MSNEDWNELDESYRSALSGALETAHPAVEQACGDERAAVRRLSEEAESTVIGMVEYCLNARVCLGMDEGFKSFDPEEEHDFVKELREFVEGRAALAQPSPAQAEQHWPKLEKPAQVGAIRFRAGLSSRLVVEAAQRLYEFESTPEKEAERIERLQAFREQCFEPLGAEFSKVLSENLVELSSEAKPEQAEAERPEVVATMYVPNEKVHDDVGFKAFVIVGNCDKDGGEFYDPEKLMTVAQHERIVGALRSEIAEWQEAAGRSRSDVVAYIAERAKLLEERDAALARVAELERQEPVALANRGLHAFWVKWTEAAAGLYGPGIKLYAAPVVQAQHSVPIAPELKRALGLVVASLEADGDRPTSKYALSKLKKVLAGAPGKEVGHE
ncbi:TPA: hypothetical protein ACVGJ1_002849 [Pseudomonas aeruginosa]